MTEQNKETVVVEGNRNPSYGWLIALAVLVVLAVLFFVFGGANLFSGSSDSQTINVETPSAEQIQPAAGQ